MEAPSAPPHVSYFDLARLFVRLSLSAFGGPVAHIAIMEDELVTRRQWLTRAHFLDLIAATNLIPGPNSTEVVIHVGYTLRGIPGALLTGFCFIFPSFLLTLALAVLYVQTGTIPQIAATLWGIKPVIVAIIAVAAYRLVPTALKSRMLWAIFALAVGAIVLTDVPEVLAMVGAGVLYAIYDLIRRQSGHIGGAAALALLGMQPLLQTVETTRAGLWDIFFYFLKIGSVLFGSGYVLIAYIQGDVVNTFGWLSSRELLDAVAIGQLTPGPVSTTVAVVGYIVAGIPGAVVGTVGIFLPSFVLVILTAPLIPRMRRSMFMGAFLSGVNAGVIAAILVTVVELGREALQPLNGGGLSPLAGVLFVASLIALIRFRINATWLILGGALVGLVVGLR